MFKLYINCFIPSCSCLSRTYPEQEMTFLSYKVWQKISRPGSHFSVVPNDRKLIVPLLYKVHHFYTINPDAVKNNYSKGYVLPICLKLVIYTMHADKNTQTSCVTLLFQLALVCGFATPRREQVYIYT